MKRRLFMRLNEAEFETLRRLRDLTFGVCSYREAVIALCDSVLVERLCLESLIETQLRRISVNLNQIKRYLISGEDEVVIGACDVLDPLIDLFSSVVSCFRYDGINDCSLRRELSVRMTADEKAIIVAVKRALKFRNYRALVMGLCFVVESRMMPPDFSFEYQTLQEYGTDINTIAKALNSGKTVDVKQINLFLRSFIEVLKNISLKATEGSECSQK